MGTIATLLSTLLKTPGATSLLGAIVNKGTRRLSKTKVGGLALLGVAPDWGELLPAVFSGDAGSIGKLVGILVTWIVVWMGRGNE